MPDDKLMETHWFACEICGMPTDLARTQVQAFHLGYCQNPDCERYKQLTVLVVKGRHEPIGEK